MKKILFTLITATLIASCASRPPSIVERDALVALSVPDEWQSAQQSSSQIVQGLTELFADETVDQLVEHILSNNLDVKRAFHQFEEAGYAVASDAGSLYPQLSTNLNTSRSKQSSGQVAGSYSATLDVSWEVDLWGKLSDENRILKMTLQSRLESYQALQDSLVAQGIKAWFDVVSNHELVLLTKSRLSNLEKRVAYSQRRFQSGLDQYDDLVALERDIAVTQADLQSSIDAKNASVRGLQLLTGKYPSGVLIANYQLPSMLNVPLLNAPISVLTERPDLRAAWSEVLSADASVSVAHKQLYPSLTLSASFGQGGVELSDIVNGNAIWSLASGLSMPLFNHGQLSNTMYEAQSRAEQAWLDYLIAARQAFNEVEQALDREQLFAQREQALSKANEYALKTEQITASRYQKGLVSILEYLDAQNTLFTIQSEFIVARSARLKNRVALALALGKGV